MGDTDLLSFAALNFGFREEVFSGISVGSLSLVGEDRGVGEGKDVLPHSRVLKTRCSRLRVCAAMFTALHSSKLRHFVRAAVTAVRVGPGLAGIKLEVGPSTTVPPGQHLDPNANALLADIANDESRAGVFDGDVFAPVAVTSAFRQLERVTAPGLRALTILYFVEHSIYNGPVQWHVQRPSGLRVG